MRRKYWIGCLLAILLGAQAMAATQWEEPPRYRYHPKRFYLCANGSMTVISGATTNGFALEDDYSGKWNFGLRLGYVFWMPGRFSFALESGASYRDFGFLQNNSTISYISIPAALRMRVGNGFLKANIFGGAEFNRLFPSWYSYPDPNNPSNTSYNLFLHQNDAITAFYGMGLLFGGDAFNVEIYTERIYQIDPYDQHFGQTIGATTLGASLHFLLF